MLRKPSDDGTAQFPDGLRRIVEVFPDFDERSVGGEDPEDGPGFAGRDPQGAEELGVPRRKQRGAEVGGPDGIEKCGLV